MASTFERGLAVSKEVRAWVALFFLVMVPSFILWNLGGVSSRLPPFVTQYGSEIAVVSAAIGASLLTSLLGTSGRERAILASKMRQVAMGSFETVAMMEGEHSAYRFMVSRLSGLEKRHDNLDHWRTLLAAYRGPSHYEEFLKLTRHEVRSRRKFARVKDAFQGLVDDMTLLQVTRKELQAKNAWTPQKGMVLDKFDDETQQFLLGVRAVNDALKAADEEPIRSPDLARLF